MPEQQALFRKNEFVGTLEAEKRDNAIESALQHADQVVPTWQEQALSFLLKYAGDVKGTVREHFTCELLRHHAKAAGFPDAPDSRAWGGIFRVAAKRGLIRAGGMTRSVGRHHGDARFWSAS